MSEFGRYYEAAEPGRRERAHAWATAIGLQDVDGLKPSRYLIKTAKRHIEGEITAAEARKLVDAYYETKIGHDKPEDEKEADKVAARIVAIVNAPGFRLSPEYWIGLHGRIFDGVFEHAGQIRSVQLTKKEWVLRGDTVEYAPYFDIERSLEYDFGKERKFRYKGLTDGAKVEHFASFISGIWQIHPFREGNTRTVALFAMKYLQVHGYDVTNDLFAEKSWYFRNALVRANYENGRLGVDRTQVPLEEFFRVLLFDEQIELKNRFLRIGSEYGSAEAAATGKLHRQDVAVNGATKGKEKSKEKGKGKSKEKILALLRRNPKLTTDGLRVETGLSRSGVEKNIRALKASGALRRIGGDKGGEWEVVK